MAVTQPAVRPPAARLSVSAQRRARAATLLLVALLAACAYAAFASGAIGLVDEARLQIGLAVVALVAASVWLAGGRLAPQTSTAGWVALALLAGFAVWCGVSLAWSLAPAETWRETNRALGYALVLVLAYAAGASAPRAVETTARGLVVVSVAVAVAALAGKVAPGLFDDTEQIARLREPLGYWNAVALVCVIGAACALGLALDAARRTAERLAALGALWLFGVVAALTYSRGGALALAVAVGVIALLGRAPLRALALTALAIAAAAPAAAFAYTSDALTTDGAPLADRISDGRILWVILLLSLGALLLAGRVALRFDRPAWRRTAWRVLAAGALLGVVALAVTGTIGSGIDSFRDTHEAPPVDDPARLLSTNSGNRLVWWEEALGAWSDAPVAGHGAGSFPVLHLQYRDNLLPVRQPHDVPLEFAAETGLIGLALGGGAIVALLVAATQAARRERGLHAALLAAGAAWTVHAFVDWDWDIPGVTVPALLALGVAAAVPARPADPAPREWPFALAGLALLLLLYVLSVALPALSESKADNALRRAGADASPQGLQAAAHEAEVAVRLNPLAVDPLFAAAAIAERRERKLEQRQLLLDAVERQPSSVGAWKRLGVLAVQLADRTGAMDAARRALALDPRNPDLRTFAQDAQSFAALPNDSPTATGTTLPAPAVQNPAP